MEDKSQERPKRPTTTKLSALYRKCNNAPGQIEDNKRPALGAFAATIVSYVFFATAQSTAMGLLLTTVPFTVLIAFSASALQVKPMNANPFDEPSSFLGMVISHTKPAGENSARSVCSLSCILQCEC
jgi:hypothetical protein